MTQVEQTPVEHPLDGQGCSAGRVEVHFLCKSCLSNLQCTTNMQSYGRLQFEAVQHQSYKQPASKGEW